MTWTSEQILALAPDTGAASAGRGLASPSRWASLGADERAVWGECQGSGAKPYQVRIDLSQPAFNCSCPSRKFPCKHGLGLFLLWAEQRALFAASERPAWVREWLDKRDATTEAKEKKAVAEAPDEAAQAKRAATREARVAAGMEELDLWLRDLVRNGLAAAQAQPARFWEGIASRMTDAQAPGIARRLREMAFIPASGEGWASKQLEAVGRLRLLMEAYRRIDDQPEELQATIRAHVGWSVKTEELEGQAGVRAEWMVVGRRVRELDARLLEQRTWLVSAKQSAMLLHFAMKGQPFEITLAPGGCLDAELVYYPGALRQRAHIKSVYSDAPMKGVPAYGDVESFLRRYAASLAVDPWHDATLAALTRITPALEAGRWLVQDPDSRALPLRPGFRRAWQLLAVSGGRPVTLFSEWNGHTLLPLSVMADRRFIDLSTGL